MLTDSPFIMQIGPGDYFAMGVFAGDVAFEAWERMTYGGIQMDRDSRMLLDWLTEVRFVPYGTNRWSYASR